MFYLPTYDDHEQFSVPCDEWKTDNAQFVVGALEPLLRYILSCLK